MLRLTSRPLTFTKRYFSTRGFDAVIVGSSVRDNQAKSTMLDLAAEAQQTVESQLKASGFKKADDVRVLYNVQGINQVAVVGIDEKKEAKETARRATALGLHALKNTGAKKVAIDLSGLDAQGAGEGAVLSQFSFDKLKSSEKKEPWSVEPLQSNPAWEKGQILGASQNVARMLMTSPSNLMTPKLFADEVAYLLAGLENVEVIVRDEEWAIKQNMNAFLAVAKGSREPLRFLEIHYRGGKEGERPHGLVGKGITFDSGGISIKPSNNMALMKGDMGGAATVAGALYGICKLKLPINVVAVTPLCENMPSGNAVKPGDVIKAMNGKSIEILDTDAEGRLVLADALHYICSKHSPASLIDLATLTGAMDVALGEVYAGVFTNSDSMWERLEKAGQVSHDPFWRMPLDEGYLKEMQDSLVADLNNLGKGRSGGACSAAAFLKEFITDNVDWAHIDIAGVMDSQSTDGYHIKGMSGRPTRSLIEYIEKLAS
ncbi:cytosol aminopeptidase family, catalytic domain-containing protein [Sporodiniella umbellata]|nr:cytosol aminopeptidase family, catalytic domain-containing protein [Sporodiniella umbellata]